MPSLASRTVPLPDNYERTTAPAPNQTDVNSKTFAPGYTPNLRCTLPAIFAATDNLRQFYSGSTSPLYRLLPVQPLSKSA